MRPAFDYIRQNIVQLLQIKSYIEVFVCIVSLVGWTVGVNAIFFAVVAMQFLRLKYTTSYYTRFCFDKIMKSADSLLPSIMYDYSFKILNNWIAGAMLKKQEEIRLAKLEKDGQKNSDEDADEPQVYEIPDDDLD